jgi:glutathione peroxidase
MGCSICWREKCETPYTSLFEIPVTDIDGNEKTLAEYQGKILIIVNVASKCGLTDKQYAELVEIAGQYHDRVEVLCFPCNQFMYQEPGDKAEICEFIRGVGGESFKIFAKVKVNGSEASPLFKYLRAKSSLDSGTIGWNFGKFLVAPNGTIVGYYGPRVNPSTIRPMIERLL